MDLAHKILGTGEPLVILHGLFGTLDNWQTIAKRLSGRRQVILVDLPNHGRSPHVDRVDYAMQAEALSDFLAGQWMHEVDVLGHSMGGKVAMRYALSYPDRVRKLIVVDMAPRAYERGHDEIFAAMRSLPLDRDLSRAELDDLLAQRIPQAAVRLFLLKNLAREREGGYRWKLNLNVLHRDYAQVLAGTEGPAWDGEALFIRGEKSDYLRDEDWPGVLRLFPGARLETIASAGHWVHAERPEELLSAVEGFLAA